ncbi:Protein SDA1 -like protein [Caligus rogercresseyi]|uniref:Protein SDA1 n=1 Tax=Caligus rogercresseyi TaxID=217165 RepID=A0A7T8HI98_CALRO|nr:Protein SDA1 -like protein [Caligus rogercresseyi]
MSHSEDEGSEDEEAKPILTLEEKRSKAAAVTESRILSDADFRKVDAEQLKKQVTAFKKGGQKRKFQESEDPNVKGREELVDLANIEMVYKKRKHDKEARLESIKKGRRTVKSMAPRPESPMKTQDHLIK